jgi:AcrR family transcriptional regulator
MSEIVSPRRTEQRRRADAERSITAILDAAVDVLAERSEASMAEIAAAAGVSRQTVYAHYESREKLLAAVADRALGSVVAAIDVAEPERGAPVDALDRLARAWWQTVEPHARVLESLAPAFHDAEHVHDFHSPILERIERLVRRGQRTGDFDRSLPTAWVTAAFLGLMHATAEEVAAQRITSADAGRAVARTVPRLLGVPGH